MKLIRIEDNRQSLLKDVHELYCKTSNKKLEDVFLYLYAQTTKIPLDTVEKMIGDDNFVKYFMNQIDDNFKKVIQDNGWMGNAFKQDIGFLKDNAALQNREKTVNQNIFNMGAKMNASSNLPPKTKALFQKQINTELDSINTLLLIILTFDCSSCDFTRLYFVKNTSIQGVETDYIKNFQIFLTKLSEEINNYMQYQNSGQTPPMTSTPNRPTPTDPITNKRLNTKQLVQKNFIAFYASQLANEFNSELQKLQWTDRTITPQNAINPVYMATVLSIDPISPSLLNIINSIKNDATRTLYYRDQFEVYNNIRQKAMNMSNMGGIGDSMQNFLNTTKAIETTVDPHGNINEEIEEPKEQEIPYDVLSIEKLHYQDYIMIMSAVGYFLVQDTKM